LVFFSASRRNVGIWDRVSSECGCRTECGGPALFRSHERCDVEVVSSASVLWTDSQPKRGRTFGQKVLQRERYVAPLRGAVRGSSPAHYKHTIFFAFGQRGVQDTRNRATKQRKYPQALWKSRGVLWITFDRIAPCCHSRECGNPENVQNLPIGMSWRFSGFLPAQE